jgi:single-strand DNA-binding protein
MNSVNLTGRLARDPRKYNNQTYLTVAVDRYNQERNADFIPVAVYGASADKASENLVKGDMVGIPNGRLQLYRDRNDNERFIVITYFVEYLSPRRKKENQDIPPEEIADAFMDADDGGVAESGLPDDEEIPLNESRERV